MTPPLKTLTMLAGLLAAQSFAQTPHAPAAAQARYQQELADCAVTHPVVNKDNCVKEARNALAEIRRGKMNESWQPSDLTRNALQRCDVHKGDDKADCIARIQGKGRTEGSVAGGGILRELTTTTVIAPPPVVQASAPRAPDAPRPSGLMSNCRWVPPTDWVCK